jgi:hypothetical protein
MDPCGFSKKVYEGAGLEMNFQDTAKKKKGL